MPLEQLVEEPQLALGLYLGYPICCIAAFCTGRSTQRDDAPLVGTGFMPCARCAQTRTAEELREYIEEHRLSPVSFPGEDPHTARRSMGFKDAYRSGRLAEAMIKALKETVSFPQPA